MKRIFVNGDFIGDIMEKMFVLHRDSLNVESFEYDENDEEKLEQLYEDYDDGPMICGTLFLTEKEVQAIKKVVI